MRLSDFILQNIEPILVQWEAFAATRLPAARHMKSLALRDHAAQILKAIAKDLGTTQTSEAQALKSMGQAPVINGGSQTAAQTHAILRAQSGFDINQLVSEYRALRASVLRLWIECAPNEIHLDDLTRFHEAIDQAVAESVSFFNAKVEESRNLLLGMLGHDMRSPLQTIQMTSGYLAALNAGEAVSVAADRLIRSGARMQALLDDLIDFNRTKLGLGIPVSPSNVDVASLFKDGVDQLRVANPGRKIDLEVVGDARGVWDAPRLQQVLANLVVNALKYGTAESPVRVVLTGNDAELRFEVINSGAAIDQSTLDSMFEPLKRGADRYDSGGNLGLGLYIASEVVKAHEGEIKATSNQAVTVFSVRLPRHR